MKSSKFKLIYYDMIFIWDVKEKPFRTQKLKFKAPPRFKLAYLAAQNLVNLLARAGGIPEKKVKLVAVAVTGALEEHMQENAPFLLNQAKELKRQAEKIKSMDLTKVKPKKSVEPIVKAKKYEPVLDMVIKTRNTVIKSKQPKARLAAPLEAMYDARKDSTKEKEAKERTDHSKTKKDRADSSTKTATAKTKSRKATSAKAGVAAKDSRRSISKKGRKSK